MPLSRSFLRLTHFLVACLLLIDIIVDIFSIVYWHSKCLNTDLSNATGYQELNACIIWKSHMVIIFLPSLCMTILCILGTCCDESAHCLEGLCCGPFYIAVYPLAAVMSTGRSLFCQRQYTPLSMFEYDSDEEEEDGRNFLTILGWPKVLLESLPQVLPSLEVHYSCPDGPLLVHPGASLGGPHHLLLGPSPHHHPLHSLRRDVAYFRDRCCHRPR